MVAVIFYSPLLLQTRVAHITAEGNITHEVHITRRRRIELAHLLYRRCAIGAAFYSLYGKKRVLAKQIRIVVRNENDEPLFCLLSYHIYNRFDKLCIQLLSRLVKYKAA